MLDQEWRAKIFRKKCQFSFFNLAGFSLEEISVQDNKDQTENE